MKKLALLALLLAAFALAQTPTTINVSTGLSCSATVSATDVVIVCTDTGKQIMSSDVTLASIIGNGAGYVVALSTSTQSISWLVKRQKTTDPLHIEASVNGTLAVAKDITLP